MEIDPNVQVALVSVFATFITTLGVVAVAVINNRKERARAADAGVEAGLDERDVLTRILSLISERDAANVKLEQAQAENIILKGQIETLRAEITMLELKDNTNRDGG